jgi:hypothetical protein
MDVLINQRRREPGHLSAGICSEALTDCGLWSTTGNLRGNFEGRPISMSTRLTLAGSIRFIKLAKGQTASFTSQASCSPPAGALLPVTNVGYVKNLLRRYRGRGEEVYLDQLSSRRRREQPTGSCLEECWMARLSRYTLTRLEAENTSSQPASGSRMVPVFALRDDLR